jgi:protein involved in temperature-dependent protein secretion
MTAYPAKVTYVEQRAEVCLTLAQYSKTSEDNFQRCLAREVGWLKKEHQALASLVTGEKNKALLKEHFISVVEQVNGIEPMAGEIGIVYHQRQSALRSKARNAWIRFELEQ